MEISNYDRYLINVIDEMMELDEEDDFQNFEEDKTYDIRLGGNNIKKWSPSLDDYDGNGEEY